MDLDRITLAVRPRNHWESIDLGFILARANFRALWPLWLMTFLPVALVIAWLFREAPWQGALVLWWLKPLFDRVPLHVLSRAVFGETPAPGEIRRALPELYRSGLLASLTYLRVDLARALNLATWQLEGLRGRARRQRVRLIEQGTRAAAAWLALVGVVLEAVVVASTLGLAYWLASPALLEQAGGWLLLSGAPLAGFAQIALYVLAVAVVEPLYVAGGFSLYLNRRTELEAWDIEIEFRRMAARLSPDAVRRAA